MDTGGSFPGVKRQGREADQSPLTSAEVKKMWIYTSTPIRHHGVVLNWLSTGTTLSFRENYIKDGVHGSKVTTKVSVVVKKLGATGLGKSISLLWIQPPISEKVGIYIMSLETWPSP
jgi:hypothetical protein